MALNENPGHWINLSPGDNGISFLNLAACVIQCMNKQFLFIFIQSPSIYIGKK